MIWFTLADRWGKRVEEVQATITSRDFVKWQHFLELQYNTPDRTDHYLMQIAAQIERFMQAFAKNPRMIALADFIIKFTAIDSAEQQENGVDAKTLTVRNEGVIVVADGDPRGIILGYDDPSELDEERIKRASQNGMANWGMFFGAAIENARRMNG